MKNCIIDVIVPVLHRPKNVPVFMDSLLLTTDRAVAWFVCEVDDLEEQEAVREHGGHVLSSPGAHTFAEKINYGYLQTSAPWLLMVGDDVRFHNGWVEAAMRVADKTGAHVIATNDLCSPFVMAGGEATHPIVRRSYIDEQGASWDGPGIFGHEGYQHCGVDTEIVDVAMDRGVFAPALDSVVEHLHPIIGKAPNDAIYQKGAATAAQDRAYFFQRRGQYLPKGRPTHYRQVWDFEG